MIKVLTYIIFLMIFSMADAGDNYEITKATVTTAGGTSTGSNFQIKGSVGQPDASKTLTGNDYGINGGIWTQNFNNDIIFKNGFEN